MKERAPKTCERCGQLIEYDPKRGPKRWAKRTLCTATCSFPAPPPKTCESCGEMFTKPRLTSREQWERQRWCSKACAAQARAKPKPPPREPPPPPEPKTCEACGDPFEQGPGESLSEFARRSTCTPACALLLYARKRASLRVPAHERVLRRTAQPSDDACWIWQGAKSQGYGVIQLGRGEGTAKAHRVVYEALIGPIPEGMTLDHLCFEPACVNPAHLEPCTREENTRRQIAAGRAAPWGHRERGGTDARRSTR